ncbi:hypothetical protein G7046_g8876 [Stylonectria norvegica]|nr:hypothetical protein G7046_g8876 [Stylonectria norvegica]
MPLWQIFHPEGTYEDKETKKAFADDITKLYTDMKLPAFYVVTNFIKYSPADLYVGGIEPSNPFIRIVINHVAYNFPKDEIDETFKRVSAGMSAILKPYVHDLGYDSEFHVGETDRRLWRINRLIPPQFGSEEQALWAKENKAVPYEGAD